MESGVSEKTVLREPLAVALNSELRRIERTIARSWVVLCVGGVIGGGVVAATIAPKLGLAMSVTSLPILVLFAVAARRLERRPLGQRLSVVVALLEGTVPWIFLAVLFFTQGAAYAMSSWIPPMLFAALLIAWVARLQTVPPLVVALSGAATYLAVYFLLLRGKLPQGAGHLILHDPPMQLTRAISLVIGGVLGAVIARELRRAIGRADATIRREELFGKYRLVRKVGSGGAGVVHEALYCPEGGFERRVAVKLLHESLITERAFVDGFRAEAELGARLAHPNVVTIMDFGRQADTFFMAMEYVDGLTLAKLSARAKKAGVSLGPDLVGHIGRSVLAGLEHAHSGVRDAHGMPLRILHRDVCPQNLLVSRIGEVKLTDFGIARVLGQAAAASTRTVAGHDAYMAPEQLAGEALTLQADLFAVGIVLWELVTGARLFARETPAATLLAVLGDPVMPVSAIRDDLNPAWDAFFAKALSRPVAGRFASAGEMMAALDAIGDSRSEQASARLGDLVTRFTAEEPTTHEPRAREANVAEETRREPSEAPTQTR